MNTQNLNECLLLKLDQFRFENLELLFIQYLIVLI